MSAQMDEQTTQRKGGQTFILLGLIAVFALVMLNFWLLSQNDEYERQYIAKATNIQVLSQQIAKTASEAAGGNLDAFVELTTATEIANTQLQQLRNGAPDTGLPPSPESVNNDLESVEHTWALVQDSAQVILDRNSLVLDLFDASNNFASAVTPMQAKTDEAVTLLAQTGAPSQQVFVTSRQLVLADRMLRRVNTILQGGEAAISAADNFSRDVAFFESVLNALLNGDRELRITEVRNPRAKAALTQVLEDLNSVKPDLDVILAASTDLFDVRSAADDILLDTVDLFNQSRTLAATYSGLSETRILPSVTAGLFGALIFLALLVWIGMRMLAEQRDRTLDTQTLNKRNQDAIMRLMDEMGSLAEGDLTVQATVTEDITGSIADSVNYAVESLRDLVMEINDTATNVDKSAQDTLISTTKLAESSKEQANQVTAATETINTMSGSFDDMANRSRESAEVAQRSVEIANNGAVMVQETISGMDTIREQIQETSKRIKRLGESSQEIGDIVELISGIAEQTNILALNAAIQAASAGGAGRGFAVVADEVQRLAERATNATGRIETLVQTIQTDTSEAVVSMETTTSEVVRGAKLAEDAGGALERIDEVSNNLSGLIQEIAKEAQEQSSVATEVAGRMNSIRAISMQSSEGTTQTAKAVDHLAGLVRQLRESVADFKLPRQKRA